MSAFVFIGKKISLAAIRDYVITHRVDSGDSMVLNAHDYEGIIHEVKNSGDGSTYIPLTLLGVLIVPDATDAVPIGKVQIVKNEKPYLYD